MAARLYRMGIVDDRTTLPSSVEIKSLIAIDLKSSRKHYSFEARNRNFKTKSSLDVVPNIVNIYRKIRTT